MQSCCLLLAPSKILPQKLPSDKGSCLAPRRGWRDMWCKCLSLLFTMGYFWKYSIPFKMEIHSSLRTPHGIGLDFRCHHVTCPLYSILLACFQHCSNRTPQSTSISVCFHGAHLWRLVPGVVLGNKIWGMMPPTKWEWGPRHQLWPPGVWYGAIAKIWWTEMGYWQSGIFWQM